MTAPADPPRLTKGTSYMDVFYEPVILGVKDLPYRLPDPKSLFDRAVEIGKDVERGAKPALDPDGAVKRMLGAPAFLGPPGPMEKRPWPTPEELRGQISQSRV